MQNISYYDLKQYAINNDLKKVKEMFCSINNKSKIAYFLLTDLLESSKNNADNKQENILIFLTSMLDKEYFNKIDNNKFLVLYKKGCTNLFNFLIEQNLLTKEYLILNKKDILFYSRNLKDTLNIFSQYNISIEEELLLKVYIIKKQNNDFIELFKKKYLNNNLKDKDIEELCNMITKSNNVNLLEYLLSFDKKLFFNKFVEYAAYNRNYSMLQQLLGIKEMKALTKEELYDLICEKLLSTNTNIINILVDFIESMANYKSFFYFPYGNINGFNFTHESGFTFGHGEYSGHSRYDGYFDNYDYEEDYNVDNLEINKSLDLACGYIDILFKIKQMKYMVLSEAMVKVDLDNIIDDTMTYIFNKAIQHNNEKVMNYLLDKKVKANSTTLLLLIEKNKYNKILELEDTISIKPQEYAKCVYQLIKQKEKDNVFELIKSIRDYAYIVANKAKSKELYEKCDIMSNLIFSNSLRSNNIQAIKNLELLGYNFQDKKYYVYNFLKNNRMNNAVAYLIKNNIIDLDIEKVNFYNLDFDTMRKIANDTTFTNINEKGLIELMKRNNDKWLSLILEKNIDKLSQKPFVTDLLAKYNKLNILFSVYEKQVKNKEDEKAFNF